MKNKSGLTGKILIMVSLTALFMCICTTVMGVSVIYMVTEDSVKNEVEYAAHTLCNVYDLSSHGEFYMKEQSLYKGDKLLSQDDFIDHTYAIGCSKDMDFTVFWGDTRMFTSIKNSDGTPAIGTHASDEVKEMVLDRGLDCYYNNVNVNNSRYVGYYIPIVNSSAKTVGMIFAGKPLDTAMKNTKLLIIFFTLLTLFILVASLLFFGSFSSRIVRSLEEISRFMKEVSQGNFDAQIEEKTVNRKDEVGQIAISAMAMKKSLRDLIERDPLTSLLNRRSCRIVIDEIITQGRPYTAAMGDIDFFKKINDNYGHACGDMVLKKVSFVIADFGDAHEFTVARWGGEEFLMIFPDKGLSVAQQILEDIMDAIRNTVFDWEGQKVSVTMTIGAAQSLPGESADKTINRADGLLYNGKEAGRNRIVTEYTQL